METKFNFNSAICTSKAQSERLLALGLKKETADMYLQSVLNDVWSPFIPIAFPYSSVPETIMTSDVWKTIPAWSLHRLIEMTKLKVTPFLYGVEISHPQWERAFVRRANVWDNLCDCIEWLIKEGYFNKEYLEE